MSHLLKAQHHLRLMEGEGSNPLRSITMELAHDAAENAFRAVLFARGISRQGDHRPDTKALEHLDAFEDIRREIEVLAAEYAWLWPWRNVVRYKHVDTADTSDPEISSETLGRAQMCARRLVALAEHVVGSR
jgi:hypothetical protein